MNKTSGTPSEKSRQLMAIMFTDIVGYTAMMQQDEKKGINIREKHRNIFSTLTEKHGGRILQYFGDGTLSVFKSSINAVQCGIEIQRSARESPEIPLRIGIHTGDIIYNEEEAIGDSVNVASRIESIAEPGSIFISAKVFDDIKNQVEVKTRRLGVCEFKNVNEPVTIYAINNEGLVVPDRLNEGQRRGTLRMTNKTGKQDPTLFISRKRELDEISLAMKQISKGRQGVVMVSGTAGVGKSALLQKAVSGIDAVVVETKVFEDAVTAFGPIINALRFLLKNVLSGYHDQLSLLEHLGLILPELRNEALETDNATLTAAIQEVFWNAARQLRVILLIEDVHWADAATIDVLPKLMDIPEGLPLFLLLSNRSDHLMKDQKIRWLRSELRRCKSFKEFSIDPFDREETASMLASIFDKVPSKS